MKRVLICAATLGLLVGCTPQPQLAAATSTPPSRLDRPCDTQERCDGDFILRQILPHWRLDYRNARYRDAAFAPVHFVLRADGTLAPPYGRNDPWNPFRVIVNYSQFTVPGREEERMIIDSFLHALHASQPFQLPPTPGRYPRRVRIEFRLGDL